MIQGQKTINQGCFVVGSNYSRSHSGLACSKRDRGISQGEGIGNFNNSPSDPSTAKPVGCNQMAESRCHIHMEHAGTQYIVERQAT